MSACHCTEVAVDPLYELIRVHNDGLRLDSEDALATFHLIFGCAWAANEEILVTFKTVLSFVQCRSVSKLFKNSKPLLQRHT